MECEVYQREASIVLLEEASEMKNSLTMIVKGKQRIDTKKMYEDC